MQFILISVIVVVVIQSTAAGSSQNTCGGEIRQAGYIFGGVHSSRGEFPWMVALKYARVDPPEFIGGGTLISSRHVITAAHCIQPKDGQFEKLRPADLVVEFGAYNLSNSNELGTYSLSPEKIVVNDDWNANVARYDADIALLIFEDGYIPFTRYVQPVCLWTQANLMTEKMGTVAGWGKSEDKTKIHEEIPKKIELPIKTNEDCLIKSPRLSEIFSKRTFCAGLDDGSGVCLGDSGNGFIVKVGGISYLRGIVSSSLLSGGECDVTNFAIYTDVLKYSDWIRQVMNAPVDLVVLTTTAPPAFVIEDVEADDGLQQTEVAHKEVTCESLDLEWNFEYKGKTKLSSCMVRNQAIDSKGTVVAASSENVNFQGLYFDKSKDVKFLPEKLAERFSDLLAMQVIRCEVKTVQKKHFANLQKLFYLSLFENKIEAISRDAFDDLSKLEILYLSNNENIKKLDPTIFNHLPSLKYVWIDQLNLIEVPEKLFEFNPHMVRICLKNNKLRYVNPTMFDGLKDLKTVIFYKNVCATKIYQSEEFREMRKDLTANCSKKN